ncbi:MAG: STAS-like domain-containing protein [Candidatus Rokuibacteriota bacterium]
MITIRLGDHGRFLGSRSTAKLIRDEIEPALKKRALVEFDCSGVESITESFAHELLRPSLDTGDFLSLLSLRHCNQVVEETIRFVAREVLNSEMIPTFIRDATRHLTSINETAAAQGTDTRVQLGDSPWLNEPASSVLGEQPLDPTKYFGAAPLLERPRIQVSDSALAENVQ